MVSSASLAEVPLGGGVAISDTDTAIQVWWLLAVSFVAISAGVCSAWCLSPSLDPALFCLFTGLLAAGGAAMLRPESAVVLTICALHALLASIGFDFLAWDSARLLLRCLAAAAGVGVLLALLPVKGKQVVASLLIVLHFGGILTAITSTSPGTWVAAQLWSFFYRPYLQFMFVNEGYHYFAPEPPPFSLLWFCVYYEPNDDGSPNYRWVRVPDFDRDGRPVRPEGSPVWPRTEYQRRLSLPHSVYGTAWTPSYDFQLISRRRLEAGLVTGIKLDQDLSTEAQYREPSKIALRWIQAYARHVARTYKHKTRPELAVTGVRVYLVTHIILNAKEVAEGRDPYDPTTYRPYYQGEFDINGEPKNTIAADGVSDPFLYWLIPIVHQSSESAPTSTPGKPPAGPLVNYLALHTSSKPEDVPP